MISIRRLSSALHAALVLAAVHLVLASATAAAAPEGPRLNLFLKSRVDQIIEKEQPAADTRKALRAEFGTIRSQQGNLTPLCNYLRTREDLAVAKPLLAMSLAANEQYQDAAEILVELAKQPQADPWITAELARIRQLSDTKKTWDMLGSEGRTATLSPDEKKRIDGILALTSDEARPAMKESCRDFLGKFGDLTPVSDYLKSKGNDPQALALLAVTSTANGFITGAEKALTTLAGRPEADDWTLAELGRIKEMQGRTEEAITLFKRAMERIKDPATRFALNLRTAQLLYDAGKTKEAGDTLRAIAKAESAMPVAQRNFCARIAGMHGDHALVAEFFQPAGNAKEMQADHLYLGETLLKLAKPDKALEHFAAALDMSTLARDRRYAIDRILATARAMNTLPQLMDTWLASESLTPEQIEIMAGVLGGELGRIGDLFKLLNRQDLAPDARKFLDSPGFQEWLAGLAQESDHSDAAARSYRELIARHPDEPSYRDGQARLLMMDGDRSAAIRIYQEAVAKTEIPAELLRIASGARGMGLKEAAIEAAEKAAKIAEKSPLETGLFMASLFADQGETDKALAILRKLESNPGDVDAAGIMALADAFERLGYGEDAIRLCRKASELDGSERILRKLISLLESNNRNDEAFTLWRKLWETAQEPMTIVQANDRLLEIGANTGKLADLAVELEERIGAAGLNEREQTLLLDIYTSVGDPVSAADVIMELADSQGGDEVTTSERLLKVYMECELFGKCNDILRKLMEIDPENRDEHLQVMAIIALERHNNGDAMLVLEELARRTPDGVLRDSFSASVLNMLGKPVDAALAHRRSLAENPDEVEGWLLWASALAARDARERAEAVANRQTVPAAQAQVGNSQARGLFTAMLEEAEADDLFVICIDGLINTTPPRFTMLNALRRLNERIAASPYNPLLYRLAADLNEEIERPEKSADVLETSLAVAGDGRSVIMRELIAMARTQKSDEEAIRIGRSMLNITEHLLPDECLSLGTLLLEHGHNAEAESAFQRVISDVNALGTAREVAVAYENAGLFEKAAKVIRTLRIGNPFDVELMLRLGLLEAKRGDFAEAGKACERALDLMIARLPSRAAAGGAGEKGSSLNIDDADQFLSLAIRSLIASARTPGDGQRLVESTALRVRNEITNLETQSAFAPRIAENPRLRSLAEWMRRIGFMLHHPAEVDAMDADLFRRYPDDHGLRADAGTARRTWLAQIDASGFLTKQGMASEIQRAAAACIAGRDAAEKWLDAQSPSPAARSAATVFLTMLGHDELIGKSLAGCDLNTTPQDDGALLLTAGLAANRPATVRDVLFTNLNRLRRELEPLSGFDRGRAYLRPASAYKQIVAAWPVLSEQDRSSATSIFGMFIDKSGSISIFEGAHHFFLSLTGRAGEIEVQQLRNYLTHHYHYLHGHLATIFDCWLAGHPAAERPAAMRLLLEPLKDQERTAALARINAYLKPETLTAELRAEFPELAPATNTDAHPADDDGTRMLRERKRFAAEIATALSEMGSDAPKMFVLHDLTLRPAANMLPPSHLDLLIENHRKSGDAFELLAAFLVLKHAGRDTEAQPVLDRIASLPLTDPKAEAAMAALPHFLTAYGWNVQALRLMRKNNPTPVPNLNLDFALHDPLAILADKSGGTLDVGIRRVHAARLMASPDQFKQAVGMYQVDTRHPDVVGEHSTSYQALLWPPRMRTHPGGLLASQPQPAGSFLADVAGLDDGQIELMHWLRTLPATWISSETEPCRQIAADAARRGLSPEIRQSLQQAAEQSALNSYDVKLIEELARKAPGELPDGLAGQMEKIALQNWRGGSIYDERNIQARKRMGVHENHSDSIAAIAAACRASGKPQLASALARWSVVSDITESGSSIHLPAYLDGLPETQRRQALTDLLPRIGLSDVRPITGEGLGATLRVMMSEGMTDAATNLADRYLRDRLTNALGKNNLNSEEYLTLVGGIDADTHVQDNAVAAVLARLKRPDDYERLLWRKNAEILRINRSPYNLATSTAPLTAPDDTGALPNPDQVDDIGRYLDIHLAIGQRLRLEGLLSPENQLARICMLGQWCAGHGLKERATNLLAQAEKLATGMLTGRLWLADLQRILGNETAADDIELQLLTDDLLPMPRVAAALDTLERSKGRNAADAMAFRLAGYTNHPQVLARALRHAAKEEMRPDYLDLAERSRKVGSLFLPAGAPCPFEGYATVADWSAAVSSTASKLPETPKPKPLAALADDNHPAINRVILKGEKPEVIYVPIIHDDTFSHLSANGTDNIRSVMTRCEEIADHLYRRYAVRNIQLEGLGKGFVEQYNRIPLQRRAVTGDNNSGMVVHRTWTRLLAEKEWLLLPCSDHPLVGPLTTLGRDCEERIVATLNGAKEKGWLQNREAFDTNKPQLDAQLKTIAEDYNAKHHALLEEDPGLKREYDITVTQRNRMFLNYLLAPKKPGVVFFGIGHWQDLEKQLAERNVSYAVVVPTGVAWPPKTKDDAAIFSDMLQLGAKLKECGLSLGDGTGKQLIVPINHPEDIEARRTPGAETPAKPTDKEIDAVLSACKEGDSDKALKLAGDMIATDPGRTGLADMLMEAGKTLVRAKQYGPATGFLRLLIERYPDSRHLENARTEMAACLYQLRKLKECQDQVRENLKLYPASRWVEYWEFLVAQTDYRLYQFAEAKTGYEAFLRKHPESQYASFARADLGRIDPKWEIDRHGMVRYSGKFEQDIRLQAALAASPRHIEDGYGTLQRLLGIDLRTHADLILMFKDSAPNTKGGLEAVTRIIGINNQPKTLIEFHTDSIVVNPGGYRSTIVHEMKHAGFINLMGKSYHDLPEWIREGLAVYGSDDVASRLRLVLSNAIIGGGDPLGVLDGIEDPDHDDRDYLEDGLAFEWLESVKPGNVKEFCRRLVKGDDYRKLWSELGGGGYEDCMAKANAHCRRRVTGALGAAYPTFVALRKQAETAISQGADATRAFLTDGGERGLSDWLEANRDHAATPFARILLGRALITAGRHEAGRALLQKILDEDAEDCTLLDDAQFFIGFSYNEEGDAPKAHQAFGVLLRDHPRSPHGKQFIGQLAPASPVTR
jgi:tetratricopeptide (TPR) repeat protein